MARKAITNRIRRMHFVGNQAALFVQLQITTNIFEEILQETCWSISNVLYETFVIADATALNGDGSSVIKKMLVILRTYIGPVFQ